MKIATLLLLLLGASVTLAAPGQNLFNPRFGGAAQTDLSMGTHSISGIDTLHTSVLFCDVDLTVGGNVICVGNVRAAGGYVLGSTVYVDSSLIIRTAGGAPTTIQSTTTATSRSINTPDRDGTLAIANDPASGTFKRGAGSPEGAVTGAVGDLYTRNDGGAGTTLYVKESGTGNTGWVAK